jgi:hypothetical protein
MVLWTLSFGKNEAVPFTMMGFKILWQKFDHGVKILWQKFDHGVKILWQKFDHGVKMVFWSQSQNTIWYIEPGVDFSGVQNIIWPVNDFGSGNLQAIWASTYENFTGPKVNWPNLT